MKKTFFLTGIICLILSLTLNAQQPTRPLNPTVDSIEAKYSLKPMPNQLTTEQIFPVIGLYQSNSSADQKITVTLDEQNKGFVWIDGLPQGRVKAVLKRSPAIYKIPAQKTADGKDVMEGTLMYDKDSKVINVVLGRPFNDEDPASVFSTTVVDNSVAVTDQTTKVPVTKTKANKSKTKLKKVQPWVFTGTKVEQVTAVNQPQ